MSLTKKPEILKARAWTFLTVFLTAAAAHAQTSTVNGTVADPLGGRLPGATVTLVGERQLCR